jgi:hypothetical protein
MKCNYTYCANFQLSTKLFREQQVDGSSSSFPVVTTFQIAVRLSRLSQGIRALHPKL